MDPHLSSAAIMAAIMTLFMICLIPAIFAIICQWIVFTKAGKPGWAILIPIYNLIIFLEIIGKPWWYMFMFLIPIYGWFILPIICINKFSKSFGQGVGFTLGLIFLNIVFVAIIAFSKSIQYIGPDGIAPATPIN
jgi:hypothetical protein